VEDVVGYVVPAEALKDSAGGATGLVLIEKLAGNFCLDKTIECGPTVAAAAQPATRVCKAAQCDDPLAVFRSDTALASDQAASA